MGVTGAQAVVDPQMLEAFVRDFLNTTAPRYQFHSFIFFYVLLVSLFRVRSYVAGNERKR
jgi:hypothetical protein